MLRLPIITLYCFFRMLFVCKFCLKFINKDLFIYLLRLKLYVLPQKSLQIVFSINIWKFSNEKSFSFLGKYKKFLRKKIFSQSSFEVEDTAATTHIIRRTLFEYEICPLSSLKNRCKNKQLQKTGYCTM